MYVEAVEQKLERFPWNQMGKMLHQKLSISKGWESRNTEW